jgi:molybdopterin synthase catalytic subunit
VLRLEYEAYEPLAVKEGNRIIDQAKVRLLIWKKEHYASGEAEWDNCRHFTL